MSGKLFLHIGRNRSGSTTLQNYWLRHRDVLLAGGVQYAFFDQQGPPEYDLPSFTSFRAMEQHLQENPSSSLLVSHEGLCCFQPEFAAAMAAEFAKLDVTLMFYVRPYRDWVVSDYVFNVLIGEQPGDFDSYLAHRGAGLRFWPALKIWGDAIGWERVRVRSLHPDDLIDGDLTVDGMAALGLAPPIRDPAPRDNASPTWISTELIRFLLTGPSDTARPIERYRISDILRVGEMIDYEIRVVASEEDLPLHRGLYLTHDQSEHLADSYNEDLDLVASYTGRSHPYDDGDGRVREFLPSVDYAPPGLLRSLQRALHRKRLLGELRGLVGDSRTEALLALGRISP